MIKSPRDFEKSLRAKYARWSPGAWSRLVELSAPKLLARNAHLTDSESERVLDAYVEICGEAIGQGKLFPGGATLETLLLEELAPEKLAGLGGAREQIAMLALMWNLCEAAAREPAWVGNVLVKIIGRESDLSRLEESVDQFMKRLQNSAPTPISGGADPNSLRLTRLDTRDAGFFLPVRLELPAPPILDVIGRTPEGHAKLSVYLQEPERILSMEPADAPEKHAHSDFEKREPFVKSLGLELSPRDFLLSGSAAAAVFRESQSVWIWTPKEAD